MGDLYPDVVASGGLGAAVREAARWRGRDVGVPDWATEDVTVETTRGYVSVDPSDEERLFRVRVHIPGFAWEIGATDDLGLLVDVIAAWRDGVPLDVLAEEFAFLELEEFAGALDRGEPTAAQWTDLLSSDSGPGDLLRRLHSDEVLRNMFPTVTHGAVRLRVDPLNRASRQVLVHDLREGRYEVLRPGTAWAEVSAEDLVPHLRAALDEDR
ncbi:hypothetical protein DF268_31805 [Streptomyces sp. V2]|uniref:hypothetical protein n=1 Tax=Streptomyces TaxID=1883 RepID=UPI0006EBC0ED|nr:MULTISPECIES: hypothetical protein [Streptomyces]PWG09503.1 hypothetical protein DF268_31805 [Streptomyces sp. V2]